MDYRLLGNLSPVRDVLPLLCVIALLGGGVMMIASAGIRRRVDHLSRRVALAQKGAGATLSAQPRQVQTDHQSHAAAYGRSEAEHRQIIRLFSKFRAPADGVLVYFTVVRIVMAFGAVAIVLTLVNLPSPWLSVLAAIGAAILGWFLPVKIVKWNLKKHGKAVSSGLPGALELLAICVEAGLSLDNGMQRVARELKGAQPALADELALTWAEMTILPNRDQALANMAARVDLPSVRSVVGTLAQSLRFGSPLAQSLRNAAEEMRNDQLMQLEERANRLPALMTVPVMLLIMPTIFLIVGGPAALRLLEIFK